MSIKNQLTTDEPHHIPGYNGYCPQRKYRYSDTYGTTTHKLLANPDESTAHSEQPILRDIFPPSQLTEQGIPDLEAFEEAEASATIERRWQSHGDQKLLDPVVPGYQGFIPKRQNHHFGRTNAKVCRASIAHFQNRQNETLGYQSSLLNDTLKQPRHRRHHTAPPFISKDAPLPTMTTFTMPKGADLRYFKAGYDGFVPRWRNHQYANTFQVGSRTAIDEFEHENNMRDTRRDMPVRPMSVKEPTPRMPVVPRTDYSAPLYARDNGIVPKYTGHVPGYRYKYGRTYGATTSTTLPPIETDVSV
ncbi:ciliary microtubule inner protein 2B-like [Sycon ciliatum]|uniref:ciliary microtubule inner protein 2B-like n=1 Tax=Sycon ciliatum TaxID=27933 RepID=UPI0031F6A294